MKVPDVEQVQGVFGNCEWPVGLACRKDTWEVRVEPRWDQVKGHDCLSKELGAIRRTLHKGRPDQSCFR